MLAPEEPELYNTKAALEGWVSNLWCAKSYRRHSPKPQKSPTALVMDSIGRAWLYCTCEWRTVYRDHLSRFRGTFHSFDPVGFAIFAIPAGARRHPLLMSQPAAILGGARCATAVVPRRRILARTLLAPWGG